MEGVSYRFPRLIINSFGDVPKAFDGKQQRPKSEVHHDINPLEDSCYQLIPAGFRPGIVRPGRGL
jgi:hypothetical protein